MRPRVLTFNVLLVHRDVCARNHKNSWSVLELDAQRILLEKPFLSNHCHHTNSPFKMPWMILLWVLTAYGGKRKSWKVGFTQAVAVDRLQIKARIAHHINAKKRELYKRTFSVSNGDGPPYNVIDRSRTLAPCGLRGAPRLGRMARAATCGEHQITCSQFSWWLLHHTILDHTP